MSVASTQGGATGPSVHVNVVGSGQMPLAMAPLHPVVAGLWRNLKKPRFSGHPEDVAKFFRDWGEVETIITSSSAFPITDYAMLMELRNALDEASAEQLKAQMLMNPNLTYEENWDSFRREWGFDAQKQNRADWFAVNLAKSGPVDAEVTLSDWRAYQARFQTSRSRVSDRTEAEERQLVFSN